jgi:hypothetical protein
MATIRGLYKRVRTFDAGTAAEKAMQLTAPQLLDENQTQLFDGKLRDGNDLSPSYLTDPYFKTPLAALNYSNWKDHITPNPNRRPGVPNLFIDGTFYSTQRIKINGENIVYTSSFKDASAILAKFSGLIFGLGGPYRRKYLNESLRPEFSNQVYLGIGIRPKKR